MTAPFDLSEFLKGLYLAAGGTPPASSSTEEYFEWKNGEKYDFQAAAEFARARLAPVFADAFSEGFLRTARNEEYLAQSSGLPENWWAIGEDDAEALMLELGGSDPAEFLSGRQEQIAGLAKRKSAELTKAEEGYVESTIPLIGLARPAYQHTGIPLPAAAEMNGMAQFSLSINTSSWDNNNPAKFQMELFPFLFPQPMKCGKGEGEIWSYFGNFNGEDYYRDIEGNWGDKGYLKISGEGSVVFFRKDIRPCRNIRDDRHVFPLYSLWIGGDHWPSMRFKNIPGINNLKFGPFPLFEGDLGVLAEHIGYSEVFR